MKLRFALIAALVILLTACNFTLAEDVTPPPGYVPPTPAPTLGPLSPASAPSVGNGAAIYLEKCLPCHGATGMGDGPQGIQLGVTVAALGLPEIARDATPAQWYTAVTRGNMERFMPPFASLTDQERWDVVAYAMTLHTTNAQIEQGKALFGSCAGCSTEPFKDQEKMSALSEADLIRMVKEGGNGLAAFANITDDEAASVAMYLRSLSFAAGTPPVAQPVPATKTPAVSAEGTPIGGTAQAEVTGEAAPTPQPGLGRVSGSIENKTGAVLPSNLAVKLRGFEHGQDPSAGPQEVYTLDGTVNTDGTFTFENVELKEGRIFIAEIKHEGIAAQSDFQVVEAGATSLSLPPIVLHGTTRDASVLQIENVHIFFDFTAQGGTIQIFAVYTFKNTSDKTLVTPLQDSQDIPFIKFPAGAEKLGYEASQNSAPFLSTDSGFAMPPNEQSYSLIAFASLPKDKKIEVSQPFDLPVATVTIFLPEGVKVNSKQLTKSDAQTIQGLTFQGYTASGLKAGDTLTFTLSGTPKETSTASAPLSQNQTLLIGAGALGAAMILAGVWLYLRDRNRSMEEEEEEEDENEFDSAEEVMDAIIALDELHRAGKLEDEAYQKRRAELKEFLKEMA